MARRGPSIFFIRFQSEARSSTSVRVSGVHLDAIQEANKIERECPDRACAKLLPLPTRPNQAIGLLRARSRCGTFESGAPEEGGV